MKILLIGPQGSGKSTQADLLAKNLGVPKITMGDIFRQITKEDSPMGKRIKEIQGKGELVDDQTTVDVVQKRLAEEDVRGGFILDGYPRTIEQVNLYSPDFDKVVYLAIPKEEVVSRLMQRGRADDTLELINKRLDLYYGQTQPLIEYYKNKGILIEIDGECSIEQIQSEIRKQITNES